MQKYTKQFWIDLAERVGFTALQAFVAQLIASGWFTVDGVTDLSILEKAGVAAIAALLAAIKGLAATFVGAPNTAAFLDFEDDTPKKA